jgi:hypothetical protein
MKHLLTLGIVLAGLLHGQAQPLKQQDRQAIKSMCGCYEVSFEYTETFAPDADYEKHPDYRASALEWVELIEDGENRISLQHLLVVNDSMVIKHWRQDWEYENPSSFEFQTGRSWYFYNTPSPNLRGTWTQKVYQVDDSPRYAGTATWIHADGRHFWENATPSPLPRREYTKRDDYNLMIRGNRHELTDDGWVHEQDNEKIIRSEGKKDVLVAQEKGMNRYRKVDDAKCTLARTWWQENHPFWDEVRAAWETMYEREGLLTLAKEVDGQPLYVHLRKLKEKGAGIGEIESLFNRFATATGNSELGR